MPLDSGIISPNQLHTDTALVATLEGTHRTTEKEHCDRFEVLNR